MALVKCGECSNQVSTEAAACPHCGAPPAKFGAGSQSQVQAVSSNGLLKAFGAVVLFGALMYVIGIGRGGDTPAQPAAGTESHAGTQHSEPAKVEATKSATLPEVKPKVYSTLAEAISAIKPLMTDERDSLSVGAGLLALWAQEKGTWAQFKAIEPTTFAKVMKDSEKERGKRICASGSVIEIATERSEGKTFYTGGMYTDSGNILRFIAVGSSGDIVQNSRATVCGVAIGRFDYANSMGGVAHAVQVVGMFDLPDNKPKDAKSPAAGV